MTSKKRTINCLIFLSVAVFFLLQVLNAQTYRWQMAVRYKMNVDFFVEKNQYRAIQALTIINNSPDTLNEIFYHLYFNAFQPGSDMDIKSLLIEDPDPRIGSRISRLKEDEMGYIKPGKISQKGKKLDFEIEGTIMKVNLQNPILPHDSSIITMKYSAQVPLQIRRTGRNNKEGVDYSMAQWYPKLCNYDEQGWHTDPYIGREFYAPWGDYDVQIRIAGNYMVAATGYLQDKDLMVKRNWKSWHFIAPNVHDFVWAADPDYVRTEIKLDEDRVLQFYHIPNLNFDSSWTVLPEILKTALGYIEKHYGPYAYRSYSFIQGGDGGMEYPMATLITGNRSLRSLIGVCLHEWMHSWYQMMLATNESLYSWMDEGFASYSEAQTMNYIKSLDLIPGQKADLEPMQTTKEEFIKFIATGKEEELSTHADHFVTNSAYGVAAYMKGSLCLFELKYICGDEAFEKGMLSYYWKWRFRHPNPNDFFRTIEQASGLELDWFKEYWVYTKKTIDYRVDTCFEKDGQSVIRLKRIGLFPMPIDLKVITDKTEFNFTIPLDLMRGFKKSKELKVLDPWHWVNPIYEFRINLPLKNIKEVRIDPKNQLVDIDPENNVWIRNEH